MADRSLSGAASQRAVKTAVRNWNKVLLGAVLIVLAAAGAFFVSRVMLAKRRKITLERTQRYLAGLKAHRDQLARRLSAVREELLERGEGIVDTDEDVEAAELELAAAEQVIASLNSQTEQLSKRLGGTR